MKKIQLKKGLDFNKEAISKLNKDQLSHLKGGGDLGTSTRGDSCSCLHHTCGGTRITEIGQA
ncbi:class I lanthipeptide [Aquimarina sp. 2201CG1-2-11]|uniref:class I lanthipeptide n=1 Tax=Aquimarina discodermiae TaxID=3231043 RepID=UPI0034632610